MSHVLDDFMLIAQGREACLDQLRDCLSMCAEVGIPIAPGKTVNPTQVITFLGFELDSVAMELRLPVDKLHKCATLIKACLSK